MRCAVIFRIPSSILCFINSNERFAVVQNISINYVNFLSEEIFIIDENRNNPLMTSYMHITLPDHLPVPCATISAARTGTRCTFMV